MTKTIAVAGATGELGKRVVHALLARGASVQALVRGTSDHQKVAALQSAGATIVVLDDVPATARVARGHRLSRLHIGWAAREHRRGTVGPAR